MKSYSTIVLITPLMLSAQTTINGGRVYMGKVDASGAISTIPYRTGTGAPSGRDRCSQPGEAYFQTDAAAGQNIWTCTAAGNPGTWSQVASATGNATQLQGIPMAAGTATQQGSFYGFMPGANDFELFSLGEGLATVGTTAEVDSTVFPSKVAASTYSPGAKQTFTSSATTAGLNVASGVLPSAPASGDLAIDPNGGLNWFDGTAWRPGIYNAGNNNNGLICGTGNGVGPCSSLPPNLTANTWTLNNAVIGSFVNAQHDHSDPANGGRLGLADRYRTCTITVGADNGSALGDADLGPQGRRCFIPAASTIVEITVAADNGTPSIVPRRNHAGTTANLVSAALATAPSGGLACANNGGTTGIDGVTTCSGTLQNTSLSAGDWLELGSGIAGGAAKRLSIAITYTVN